MIYTFQIWRHPNIRYREAIQRLSRCELLSMLRSLSVDTDIRSETIGSASFLSFECRPLSAHELVYLRSHSSVVLMAVKKGKMLLPIRMANSDPLPDELPEILKYKGKTNPVFMRMMLNTALSMTPFAHQHNPVTVLDPLCGRGTGLFCALCSGANAVGMDLDRTDIKEASDYFGRFLKLHHLKHQFTVHSKTFRSGAVPVRSYRFAYSKEMFHQNNTRYLTLCEGDTGLTGELLKKEKAHVLITDLPYGIQHAPQSGKKTEPFVQLLSRAVPSWKNALFPGASVALSFNSLTLKPDLVRSCLQDAGFILPSSDVYSGLGHSVEQAVIRDLVFATVPAFSPL